MAKIVCLISLCLLIATYGGYPLFLMLLRLFYCHPIKKEKFFPRVSLIIAAYNEERIIEKKICNSLELEYPPDLLEIIIGSDCSSDRTDEIVKNYASKGVKLIHCQTRRGKTGAQNEAFQLATGQIIVYSDVDFMLAQNALSTIVQGFMDSSVGCIGGKLVYNSSIKKELNEEKRILEKVDQYIRRLESEVASCVGVDGAIYAIRRELVREMPEGLTSDFLMPLDVIRHGYRVIYEDGALAYGEVSTWFRQEFRRKIRTVCAGATVLSEYIDLLNPFRYGIISISLIFHKMMRWVSLILMVALLCSSYAGLANCNICILIFYLQIAFMVVASIGFLLKRRKATAFTMAYFIIAIHLAAVVGLAQFIFGQRSEKWTATRD